MINHLAFGEKLKSYRKEQCLTQEELAEKIGVSGQAVSKWEKGECIPDVYNLKLLARFYNISMDSLLEDGDKEKLCSEEGKVKNEINFNYPFSGFNDLSFSNCLASVQMYHQKMPEIISFFCPAKEGLPCINCGQCKWSSETIQESIYFMYDTVSSRSSQRPSFTHTPENIDEHPEIIDYMCKFAESTVFTTDTDFSVHIKRFINEGKPVIARMKDKSNGAFRVITGYDGDSLVMANPGKAQRKPNVPAYDGISEIIVITETGIPQLSVSDCFSLIEKKMGDYAEAGIWDEYIGQFMYWDGGLKDADFEEIKRRFKRIRDIAWYNFNCHNFAETFRRRITLWMQDPRIDEACRCISESYDNAHTCNWQLVSLYECREWSRRLSDEFEWGYCSCVIQCLEKLRNYDKEVLAAIREIIWIFGGN